MILIKHFQSCCDSTNNVFKEKLLLLLHLTVQPTSVLLNINLVELKFRPRFRFSSINLQHMLKARVTWERIMSLFLAYLQVDHGLGSNMKFSTHSRPKPFGSHMRTTLKVDFAMGYINTRNAHVLVNLQWILSN